MHADVAHTGIWPGGLQNSTGCGEADVDFGYSAACQTCSAVKAHRAAQEDQVFGVKFSTVHKSDSDFDLVNVLGL